MPKILIVKTSALGDIIHVFPVLEYLRNKFPEAQIDWVVEKPFAELPRAHPYVSSIIPVDTKCWRKGKNLSQLMQFKKSLQSTHYDFVFDLQGNIKSGFITWLAHADNKIGFGKATVAERPNSWVTNLQFDPPAGHNIREDYLYIVQSTFGDTTPFHPQGVLLNIDESQKARIQQILQVPQLTGRKKCLICPGAAWINKRLSDETLSEFLRLINREEKVAFLFAWGSQEEEQLARKLQGLFPDNSLVLERLPLSVLQNLMKKMDLVVAMDSLPLHLAGATGVSTYSLFGPSSAEKYRPLGIQNRSYQGNCPYGEQFTKRCSKLRSCPTGACLKDLTGDQIYHSFREAKK